MLSIDRRSAQLKNVAAQRLIGSKTELLLGVVAEICRCRRAGLHPISAHDASVFFVLDKQMLAENIEMIAVQPRIVRTLESLAQFNVEDLEAQAARSFAIRGNLRESHSVAPHLRMDARPRLRLRKRLEKSGWSGFCLSRGWW